MSLYMDFIIRDPGICGGEAVIKGTRVPIRTILASLAEGATGEQILADFPTLTENDVRAVIAFTAACFMKSPQEFLARAHPASRGMGNSA